MTRPDAGDRDDDPLCLHCGEFRLVERIGAECYCRVCGRSSSEPTTPFPERCPVCQYAPCRSPQSCALQR